MAQECLSFHFDQTVQQLISLINLTRGKWAGLSRAKAKRAVFIFTLLTEIRERKRWGTQGRKGAEREFNADWMENPYTQPINKKWDFNMLYLNQASPVHLSVLQFQLSPHGLDTDTRRYLTKQTETTVCESLCACCFARRAAPHGAVSGDDKCIIAVWFRGLLTRVRYH